MFYLFIILPNIFLFFLLLISVLKFKHFKENFIFQFSIIYWLLSLLLYLYSFSEGQDNIGNIQGSLFETLRISFEYYWLWVYPFWWFILLILSIVISGLLYLVLKLSK